MELYSGSTLEFIKDAAQHQIAEKLGKAYLEYYQFKAVASEFTSWQNSLTALTLQIQQAQLFDNGIILELQLPLSSARLDALITGHNQEAQANAVIIELKQWSVADFSEIDDCVDTVLGGAHLDKLHPSAQAGQYRQYLADMNSAFHEAPAIGLKACSWLHNLDDASHKRLTSARYAPLIEHTPVFTGHTSAELREFLQAEVSLGNGLRIVKKISEGRYRPSKGLMAHAASVIAGDPIYTLLDDQLVASNLILQLARKGMKTRAKRAVVAINGGPGTGKSVIAINLMAQLLREGKNVQHATGSRAFTGSLRERLGSRLRPLLQYFNSYTDADPGVIDVLIMDEAHRIRESSNHRYTPKAKKSSRPQIDELVSAARVSVFFIDDHQVVRPDEVGSSRLIQEAAVRNDALYKEVNLSTQFRCAGSEQYVDWVDQLLGIRQTAVTKLDRDSGFDFLVIDSPVEVDALIRSKVAEGSTGRITAGFCWPWSKANADGTLVSDVRLSGLTMPWNARPESTRLAQGIPKAQVWATDARGIDQIGCVYTAQGFEFDYVGVIIGQDLQFDSQRNSWTGDPARSRDPALRRLPPTDFGKRAISAYRILLTRGMKGCYVYCVDPETAAIIRASM